MSCWRGIWQRLRARGHRGPEDPPAALRPGAWEVLVSSPLTRHRPRAEPSGSLSAESFCPCCRRPIDVQLVRQDGTRKDAPGGRVGPFAYVSLLYGESPASAGYVLGALALGQSLRASGTSYDMVLLHTSDVPKRLLHALDQSGLWRLHEVEYLHGCHMLGSMRTWEGIFTKLRLFSLAEYQKVLFLDLDVLVLQNIDELFALQPPAATLKGAWQPAHGARINGRYFFPTESWNEPHGGINAGVMLLQPSVAVHQQMEQEVVDEWHPEHIHSYGPEQEYISRFFADRWTHIAVRYNFQLFRLDASRPLRRLAPEAPDPEGAAAPGAALGALRAVQFSSFPKPWELLGLAPGDLEARLAEAPGAAEGGPGPEGAPGLARELLGRWRAALGAALEAPPPGALPPELRGGVARGGAGAARA